MYRPQWHFTRALTLAGISGAFAQEHGMFHPPTSSTRRHDSGGSGRHGGTGAAGVVASPEGNRRQRHGWQGEVGDSHLPLGRAAADGYVGPQSRGDFRHSQFVQTHPHQGPRHSRQRGDAALRQVDAQDRHHSLAHARQQRAWQLRLLHAHRPQGRIENLRPQQAQPQGLAGHGLGARRTATGGGICPAR